MEGDSDHINREQSESVVTSNADVVEERTPFTRRSRSASGSFRGAYESEEEINFVGLRSRRDRPSIGSTTSGKFMVMLGQRGQVYYDLSKFMNVELMSFIYGFMEILG